MYQMVSKRIVNCRNLVHGFHALNLVGLVTSGDLGVLWSLLELEAKAAATSPRTDCAIHMRVQLIVLYCLGRNGVSVLSRAAA